MAVEVLEHVASPERFLGEIYRILGHRGRLIITVPFSARIHFAPFDYRWLTKTGLEDLFQAAGFVDVNFTARGNEYAAICNSLLVTAIRDIKCGS